MIIQLNPPIPFDMPKGKGFAYFLLDYSQEHDMCWVTFIEDTGECWTFRNPEVRIQAYATLGRHRSPTRRNETKLTPVSSFSKMTLE